MQLIEKTSAKTLGELLGTVNPLADLSTFLTFLKNLLSIALDFVGMIAVIMILYAAFLYVTAYGDDSKAERGKKTIFWAIIGLVLAAVAQILVSFLYQYLKATPGS